MSATGFWTCGSNGRSVSRQRRSILLRSTARAAVFFDTTDATLTLSLAGSGTIVREKRVPCRRCDFTRAMRRKSARESRYFFGMVIIEDSEQNGRTQVRSFSSDADDMRRSRLYGKLRAAFAAAAYQDILAARARGARPETVRPRTLALLRLPISFRRHRATIVYSRIFSTTTLAPHTFRFLPASQPRRRRDWRADRRHESAESVGGSTRRQATAKNGMCAAFFHSPHPIHTL